LGDIHLGHIRNYQEERAEEAGPNKINQEVGTLIRILKAGECWTPQMDEMYMPLDHIDSDIPRAISLEEQERWLAATASTERLYMVNWYSIVALRTALGTNEMRGLQLGDINMAQRVVMVRSRSAKNKYRQRTVPLLDDAAWAMERLLERSRKLGSGAPQHFLFPFRLTTNFYDPTRGMGDSGLKRLWGEARDLTGIRWRPYDTRHTACTRMAEAGVPVTVIMSYAGHFSRKMFEHYQHISEQAQRKWGDLAQQRMAFPPKMPSIGTCGNCGNGGKAAKPLKTG
jgi:integrase